MPYSLVVIGLWVGWAIYWSISASRVKATARRETFASRASYDVLIVIASVLVIMSPPSRGGFLFDRMWPESLATFWIGVAVLAAGLAFSVWARIHLGANWSAVVMIKEDHELVRDGPYALVRHPIYTGILLAFIGTAIARGEWRGAVAVALIFVAFWRKLTLEERWLGETFGEKYAKYRTEVSALVPFLL